MATSRPGKRLIVGCDGTWLDRDDGLDINGKIAVASNVSRILSAIHPVTPDDVHQVTFYQNGIGSTGTWTDKIIDGATAKGLSANIREAYDWIGSNYAQAAHDEIFLIGFSRGAFTARSIAGMIDTIGVLTKAGLPYLAEIFEDFEHRLDQKYKPSNPNIPFPNKPSVSDPAYARKLQELGMTTLNASIKAVAVWDTVGSLGIPRVKLLEDVGLQNMGMRRYQFFDTALENCVENAFQALALDEQRSAFTPTVWEKKSGNNTYLRQAWFPGVHKNCGGGYADMQLANITLAWMMDQLSSMISFRLDYILEQYEKNEKNCHELKEKDRPWSFGEIRDSSGILYKFVGTTTRTPGQYKRLDERTGEATEIAMRETNEHIHPAVRSRIKLKGPGLADKGFYQPPALEGFEMVQSGSEGSTAVQWELRKPDGSGQDVVLSEDKIGDIELELLKKSPEVYTFLMGEKQSQ